MAIKSLKTVLRDIDHSNDDLWTASGHPRVAAVNELAGEGAAYTSEEINGEWGDRKREVPDSEAPTQAGAARNDQGHLKDESEKLTATEGAAGTGEKHDELVTAESGIIDLDENPDAPEIRGRSEASENDRVAKLNDVVILFTPNPINSSLRNEATITRLNSDGTINVAVRLNNGGVQELSSVKNEPTQGPTPYWRWPNAD